MKNPLYFTLMIGVMLLACQDPERPFEHKEVAIADLVDGKLEVKLNPYGRCPLGAELSIDCVQKTEVRLSILGEEMISTQFTKETEHRIPVLGLYPDSNNMILLELIAENGWFAKDTLRIQTDPLPDFLPEIQIVEAQSSKMEAGLHFSNFNRPVDRKFQKYPLMFDNRGNVRWFLDLSEFVALTFPIQRFEDGFWYIFQDHKIVKFSMLGEKVGEIELGSTYRPHHDLIELPNGNLVVMVNKEATMIPSDTGDINSWGDHLVEVEPNTGNVIREWDLRELLDVDRYELKADAGGDWFHGNSVWHDPTDDGLIISGRNQGVVKVSQDNKLMWILAPHSNWGKAGVNGEGIETQDYLLTAIGADGLALDDSVQAGVVSHFDFDWAWGQHSASILPNGNLVLFDNGFARQFGQAPLYSRVVEYEIDAVQKTVKQVLDYGAQRGENLYSKVISNATWLPNTGNLLMMPGLIRVGVPPQARMVEVAGPNAEVVFEAALTFKNSGGNGSNTWGNVDAVYRAGRMSLYP